MRTRGRLGSLALAAVLAAGCGASPATPTSNPSAAEASPAIGLEASSNPCPAGLTLLAAFGQRLANDLAAIRSHVVGTSYRSPETVAALRPVATTLTAYKGLEATLGDCDPAAELATSVGSVRTDAGALLDTALGDSNVEAAAQRMAAADLFGLLPDVLALSEAGAAIAQALGLAYEVARLPDGAAEPIGRLDPLPTPTARPTAKPASPPTAVVIQPSFFGSDVTVSTFKVKGDTPSEISESIGKNGPYMAWLGGTAAGATQPKVAYRFHLVSGGGRCRIVVDASPPIKVNFTIILPSWRPTSGTLPTAVKWWNDEVREIATHEKGHVVIVRDAARRLNTTLTSSTCANVERRLDAVWKDAKRDNCEFDMKEYGTAAGLSLKACLNN